MSITVSYGVRDDHGKPVGPWCVLELSSPDGDRASELLDLTETRRLANRLIMAADRAEVGHAGTLGRKVGSKRA